MDENLHINENRRNSDAHYAELIGNLRLHQKSIDDVQKHVDRIESDFKETIKDHRATNERIVEAIREEVKELRKGFAGMADNLKRIQYIMLGGALFYVLDTVGLKTFFLKIMGA